MRLTPRMRERYVSAAIEDIPRPQLETLLQNLVLPDCVAKMPPAMRLAYKQHPEWFATTRHRIGTAELRLPVSTHYVMSAVLQRRVKRAKVIADQAQQRIWPLQRKLREAAGGVRTTQQLAALLPEFAQYIPTVDTVDKVKDIAREALVQDFKAAGWKKGKK